MATPNGVRGLDVSGRRIDVAQLLVELQAAGFTTVKQISLYGPPDQQVLVANGPDGFPRDLPAGVLPVVQAHVPPPPVPSQAARIVAALKEFDSATSAASTVTQLKAANTQLSSALRAIFEAGL